MTYKLLQIKHKLQITINSPINKQNFIPHIFTDNKHKGQNMRIPGTGPRKPDQRFEIIISATAHIGTRTHETSKIPYTLKEIKKLTKISGDNFLPLYC